MGSEGTCVTVLQSRCALKHSPQHRRLVVLGFADPFIAADHVPAVLKYKPIGLEGFDGLMVDYMLRKHLAVNDVLLLPEGRGFLLCEFGADSAEDADTIAEVFTRRRGVGKTAQCGATPIPRRGGFGKCANLPWAPPSLFPGKGMDGKGGRIPPCRRKSWAAICATSISCWKTMAIRRPCTDTSAKAAFTCALPSIWKPPRESPNIASSSSRPRISSSHTEDPCRANTAMVRRGGLCCPKCTAPS